MVYFCFSSNLVAETSAELINNNNWNGATYGADPGGCCASISGSGPLYDTNTNTILFSYGRSILSQTIAIQQALQASGIEVDGYQYSWTYRLISNNNNLGTEELIFTVVVKDSNGNVVETYTYNRSAGQPGIAADQWYTDSGTETFNQSYLDPQSISLQIQGKDGGFWAGYYGPEVKNVSLKLTYSANPCASNPLYDPSCPGYAEALAEQQYNAQCAADPLYDMGCPGYASAYYTQQCSINPLYDSGCPGYAQAYYDQQCTNDALYDSGCPGYAQAYYNQQCSANPLYDTGCPGYEQAYLAQQCSLNDLYSPACPGYAEAYYNQQCSISALYDPGCPGYAVAYHAQQCSIDALYASDCPGYSEAYFAKFVKPGLDAQIEQAAGTTTSEPVAQSTTIESPAQVSITGDAVIDSVLAPPVTTSVTSVTSPISVIPVAPSPPPEPVVEVAAAVEETTEEKQEEVASSVEAEAEAQINNSNASPSAEQKQNSKREKIKQILAEKGKELANDMSKATSMEAQRNAQNLVMSMMGFNPDFSAYKGEIPQPAFYDQPQMPDAKLPTNNRGLRNGLAQQLLHEKMVEMQYENR